MKLKPISLISLLVVAAGLFVWAFAQLPLTGPGDAVDWKVFHQSTSGFRIDYPGNRVYNPPWTLASLWPLTAWRLDVSRGLAALATLIVFAISVPRNRTRSMWAIGVVLLMFSYPMVRHLVDGNLEAMIVGGALLALYALPKKQPLVLAASFLLLTAKVQETWLLLLILGWLVWRRWPKQTWLQALGASALVAVPFLAWKGGEWMTALQQFPYARTPVDSSLVFAMQSIGIPDVAAWAAWACILVVTLWLATRSPGLDHAKAGLLITAGLMLSTYAAGNSLVTVLALGVIPFFQRKPTMGLGLIALYYLPYVVLTQVELRLAWENVYWAGVLFATWAVLVLLSELLGAQRGFQRSKIDA